MEKLKLRIEKLKNRILEYISNDGNIYAPKRELPYYEYMASIVKDLKKHDPSITYEDVYALCGIEFDRDYYAFKTFLNELKSFNKNGYVDSIRTTKARLTYSTYEKLKTYAEKYNTTPFDFLVLMTPYSFETCFIQTDNYEETLKSIILNKYPNKDISGIKRENPEQYEQLRELQKYYPYPISMYELVIKMGFNWPRASKSIPQSPNETEILDELNALFPDKIVSNLRAINPSLYNKIIKIARANNEKASIWLEKHGFNYIGTVNISPLSQIKVDSKERRTLLKKLKQQAIQDQQLSSSNEIELFRASLNASKTVINYLNTKSATEQLMLTDKLTNKNSIQFE